MMQPRHVGGLLLVLAGCTRPAPPPAEIVSQQLLVRADRAADLEDLGRVEPGPLPGWWRLALGRDVDAHTARETLRHRPGVHEAQFNLRYTPDLVPDDPEYGQQYAHGLADAPRGWDIRTDAPQVVVAVIGTGIDRTHPELARRMWTNPNEIPGNGIDDDNDGFVDDVYGWDFVDDDGVTTPTNDHETAVACVIGAEANNGQGIAGVVWNARLMSLRVLYQSDQVAAAIRYAVDHGAQVINMSFGSYVTNKYGPDGVVREALEYAESRDVVAVATAGNDAVQRLRFPAAHDRVVAVGASDAADNRASFSNHGTWISVAAPGANIMTCVQGGYARLNGTSYAAPYVAGVAALVRAEHPEWSAAEVRYVLEASGDRITTDRPIGISRVDVAGALQSAGFPEVHAQIRYPYDGLEIYPSAPLEVRGTAVGASFEVALTGPIAPRNVGRGAGPIFDGRLAELDTVGLPEGEYRLILSVRGASGATAEHTATIIVGRNGLPGFPYEAAIGIPAYATVGDIDGDGDREIVIADLGGLVHAIHHDGTSVAGFPVRYRTYPGLVALGDLDGDGDVEIIVGSSFDASAGAWVHALHHDGTAVAGWDKSLPGRMHGGPALADVDLDGRLEVIMATYVSGVITAHVFSGEGQYEAGWPADTAGSENTVIGGPATLAIANVDADPELEIGIAARYAWVFEPDGAAKPGWPILVESTAIAAADLDADGVAELVTAGRGSALAFHGDGTTVFGWPQASGDAFRQPVAVGDLDGDGRPEVVATDEDGQVRMWRADGSSTPGWPQTVPDIAFAAGPTLADLDGDGNPDVLVPSTDGQLFAWRVDGRAVPGFPRPLQVGLRGTLALADLDGDGLLDVAGADGPRSWQVHAFALSVPADAASLSWDRRRGNAHNTGYHPGRFALEAAAPVEGTLQLTWTPPADVPTPRSYSVYRDDVVVAEVTTTTWSDIGLDRLPHEYVVVALDETRGPRARSVPQSTSWPEAFCRTRGDGATCDDGNPCTRNDACVAERCVGTPDDGIRCDDGSACTRDDVCAAGACVGQDPVVCLTGPCDDARCDPSTGQCVSHPRAEGSACDDLNPCTEGDICSGLGCRGRAVTCDTGDEACGARGTCDPTTGACSVPAAEDGAACDDGDGCTESDRCLAGVCGGQPLICQPISGCDQIPMCSAEEGRCVAPEACVPMSGNLDGDEEGCGCRHARGEPSPPWVAILGLGLWLARRRRFS